MTSAMTFHFSRRTFATGIPAGLLAGAAGGANTAPAPRRENEFAGAAPNAILLDAESGTVLFEKNADELLPPARGLSGLLQDLQRA